MINIIDAFKELLTIKKSVQTIAAAPKSGYLTTEWLGIFLTGLSSIYMGAHNLIPPVLSVEIGIGLSLVWLIFRQILKWKHLSLATVAGIPDLDVDTLINLIVARFPKIAPASADIKAVVTEVTTEIKSDPPAVPAPSK